MAFEQFEEPEVDDFAVPPEEIEDPERVDVEALTDEGEPDLEATYTMFRKEVDSDGNPMDDEYDNSYEWLSMHDTDETPAGMFDMYQIFPVNIEP